jgi:hypothetical protein
MPSYTSKKLAFNNLEQFKESFSEPSPTIGYIYIGNALPYANESSPDSITDTVANEKSVWDNMLAAKRITGNDVEIVVPRVYWSGNTKYRQYDDTIEESVLVSANTTQNLKPMYVITSGRSVYKCLSNNSSANSTVEPSGDYTTSNGNIATSDGYIWKYLYNVSSSNRFLTTDWMPAPSSTAALDYNVNDTGVVDGELTSIIVTANGTNYTDVSNVRVNGFSSGQTSLQLSNTALTIALFNISTLANLSNLVISGTGIPADSYISSISNTTGVITLSAATNNYGGNANNITVGTRIYVFGDGTGVAANATISNTQITKTTVTTIGTGYTKANVFIYGSGSGASARAILPPALGHAYNPAKELCANSVMVTTRIGEIDTTEGGLISSNTSFRQFGFLRDPYKYGSTSKANTSAANSVISQTTNMTVVAGTNYVLGEFVYQGTASNPSASGYVNSQTTNALNLSNVTGTFNVGLPLKGLSSGASRTVITIKNPEFAKYRGDILYAENAVATTRTDGQAENIKLVISF